ncbi:MAG: aspartate/glutamate racemase family protein [Candidatus Scalinduaceae bacterium]
MSSDHIKHEISKKRKKPTTLRKIHRRIAKVKLVLQERDKNFFNIHHHLFEQLEEPRQRFIDTIDLNMDDGNTKPIKLFLVQHNLAFGPGQGVLKFIKQVYLPKRIGKTSLEDVKDIVEKLVLEEVEILAMEKSLYHALHNVKLGGAGCAVALIDVNKNRGQTQTVELHMTKTEIARLSREIGYRLTKYRIMSPDGFWPEPDGVTTDEQILNWVEDEALKTLLLKHLLAPKDKELLDTLYKVHDQMEEEKKTKERDKDKAIILATPYHDAALMWLKEWRATKRGAIAMKELVSKISKAGKHYRKQVSRIDEKYGVVPSIAKDILAIKRLLAVMYLPFRDYKPNGQIVVLDTGVAPAIGQENLSKLKGLDREDVVLISVLSKRLGGSSSKRIKQLCRIYVEAAYNLGAKIVLLCNTMDANARATVVKEFSIPILGPIEPAVKAALSFGKTKGIKTRIIGIIATKATIESGAYIREIKNQDPEAKIFSVVTPLLATIVDMVEFDRMDSKALNERTIAILEANLRPLIEKNIDTLILGCTHYGVFEQAVHDIWRRFLGKDIHIVDSSRKLTHYTLTYLRRNKMLSLTTQQKGTISHMASEEDTLGFKRGVLAVTGRTAEVLSIDIGEVVGRLSEEDRLFQKTVANESREDVNLRGVIINSDLSAEAKVAIADKLYGAGNMDNSQLSEEILSLELRDEHIRELDKLATQSKGFLKILSHIKDITP